MTHWSHVVIDRQLRFSQVLSHSTLFAAHLSSFCNSSAKRLLFPSRALKVNDAPFPLNNNLASKKATVSVVGFIDIYIDVEVCSCGRVPTLAGKAGNAGKAGTWAFFRIWLEKLEKHRFFSCFGWKSWNFYFSLIIHN